MNKAILYFVKNPFLTFRDFFAELGDITRFTQTAVVSAFSPPYKRSITRLQMDAIGVGSLPIVTLTGLFMGLVLALQSIVELRNIGATSYLGRPVGTTVMPSSWRSSANHSNSSGGSSASTTTVILNPWSVIHRPAHSHPPR